LPGSCCAGPSTRYSESGRAIFRNRLLGAILPHRNVTGEVAVDMGWSLAPRGFRILSNFGREGMQSQSHGHIHVIGGMHLGEYA